MEVKANQVVSGVFATASPTTGMGADPAGLGTTTTGRVYINGVYASGVAVALADEAATDGVTQWTFTVPGTVVEGNHIQCQIFATVGGIVANETVFSAMVVARLPGELALATALSDLMTAATTIYTDTQDVRTKVGTTGVVVGASSKNGYALTSAYEPAKTAAQATDLVTAKTVIDNIRIDTQAILDDTGTNGVVVAAASKTGYTLTAPYDPAKTAAPAMITTGAIVTAVNASTVLAKKSDVDALGSPVQAGARLPSDYPINITYNGHGDIETVTWHGGDVMTYTYNTSFQLLSISVA